MAKKFDNFATNDDDEQEEISSKKFNQGRVKEKIETIRQTSEFRTVRRPLKNNVFDLGDDVDDHFHGTVERRILKTPQTPTLRIKFPQNSPISSQTTVQPNNNNDLVNSRTIRLISDRVDSTSESICSEQKQISDDDSDSDRENQRPDPQTALTIGPAPNGNDYDHGFEPSLLTNLISAEFRAFFDSISENLTKFVSSPMPKTIGQFNCRISRDKRGLQKGMFPTYYMYAERPNDGRKILILAARRRMYCKTSNYVITTDPTDLTRDTESFCGKLKGNILGTQFTLYDQGQSSKRASSTENLRKELATIIYETNILGLRGPRKMTVVVPSVQNENQFHEIRSGKNQENLFERLKHGNHEEINVLHNKSPVWSDETQSYVLNFHGRVTEPSVKNFQLVFEDEMNSYRDFICLQFGRIVDDAFNCDFQHPLSPLQAFGIALSSLDSKLACE